MHRPRVDIASFGDAYLDSLVEAYDRLQRDVWVLDITSDLGVPTFAAISRRREGNSEDIILGFGAHVDAHAALRHALREMNHILPAVLPGNRTPTGDYPYPEASQKQVVAHGLHSQRTLPGPRPPSLGRSADLSNRRA